MIGAVVAVDYGRRRLGVAASDPLGITAQGIATLDARDRAAVLAALSALVVERDAVRVLVGHPINMDGTEGPMAREAVAFAEALRTALAVPVELVDERLTSFAADAVLREAGLSRRDRARHEDRVAAAILLRGWLDMQGREHDR